MYVGRPVGLHIVSGVGRPAVPVFGGMSIIDTFFICFHCVCTQVAVITLVLPSIQNALGSAPNFPLIFQTIQAIYVYRNIEVRSCDHCCSGKAVLHILRVCL